LLLPQELAARIAIPALRALVARNLVIEHGFSQRQAARKLGITQATVSNYIREKRGIQFAIEETEEIKKAVQGVANNLANGVEQINAMTILTNLTQKVLATRQLCEYHAKLDPTFDASSCPICDDVTEEIARRQ